MNLFDQDKTLGDLTDEECGALVERVRADFKAAEDNRDEREDIALQDYELYGRKRRDAEAQAAERGGWSKLEVPLVYWIVEHQVPRMGVATPTATVKANSPEAVGWATAKQLRLQHYLDTCGWDWPYQMIQRSKLILGDGIAKVPWSPYKHSPSVLHVDWFDFFVSDEAATFEAARVHFHRTFWSAAGIMRLAREEGVNGRIYRNLDDLHHGMRREQVDDLWERRRNITGQGIGATGGHAGGETIPLLECWYDTGELVVLAGDDYQTCVRAQLSPYRHRDDYGAVVHERPFAFFRNIPDLTGPYSISEPRVLGDHQIEMSTLRNQAIDQITANLNAPIVHDEQIRGEDIDAAFAKPKGRLAVPWGSTGPLIQRMPPGSITNDMPTIYEHVRSEAQLVSGINDNAAGQPVNTEQTATEVSILASEANRRMQLKQRQDEIAMGEVVRMFDWRDRQFGTVIHTPVPNGTGISPGALGFMGVPKDQSGVLADLMAGRRRPDAPQLEDGYAQLETVPGDMSFNVSVDAGSSSRPDQREEAQKAMALVAALSHPRLEMGVNWQELLRHVIQVHGVQPDRFMQAFPPPQPPPGQGGGPTPEQVPGAPPQPETMGAA